MPKSVFVAADVGSTLLTALEQDPRFDLTYTPVHSTEELIARVTSSQVLVTRHHNWVSAAVIDAAPHLQLIAQGTSGLDNIDLDHAQKKKVKVAGLPGENANAVAELVLSHMIALTRDVPAYNEMVREGRWEREDCVRKQELRSHHLGIIGLGRVGSRVSALAGQFGINIRAYDPYLSNDDFQQRGAIRVETLDELLQASDIITLHVPLTGETKGMLGRRELERMKKGSYVINCSRGAVLDQKSLFELLDAGTLGGAALDVFDPEPPGQIQWPSRGKFIATPHIAGCSKESKESIGQGLYRAICSFYGFDPHTS